MTDKTYERLKWIAQIWLPALGGLYFSIAELWHLPMAPQVVGTITILDTFLGAIVGVSSKVYNASSAKYAGAVNVRQEDGRTKFTFVLDTDPEDLLDNQDAVFKVNAPKTGVAG